MAFRHRIKVRYAETDQMGVVHHSIYAVYFEEARIEYLRYLGQPYRDLEEKGILMPLLDIHIRYIKPARFDDTLDIEVDAFIKGAKIFVSYTAYRGEEKVAEGRTTHVCTDTNLRPIRPPASLRRILPTVPKRSSQMPTRE